MPELKSSGGKKVEQHSISLFKISRQNGSMKPNYTASSSFFWSLECQHSRRNLSLQPTEPRPLIHHLSPPPSPVRFSQYPLYQDSFLCESISFPDSMFPVWRTSVMFLFPSFQAFIESSSYLKLLIVEEKEVDKEKGVGRQDYRMKR